MTRKTEIIIILDRSGSMQSTKNVGAYRSGLKADMSFDASDIYAQAQAGVK